VSKGKKKRTLDSVRTREKDQRLWRGGIGLGNREWKKKTIKRGRKEVEFVSRRKGSEQGKMREGGGALRDI